MAETQTVNETSTPKNPVGRPRKDGQPAGTVQEPPVQQGEDLLLLLPAISPEEWQHRQLYLYRLYPITDRRGAGQPVYLCKYSETVDKDRIKRDYGSGIYKLELLLTLPNERGKKLAAAMFQIVDMDFPPKVPAGEWVDDPRNADWQWCRPRLGPQANGVAAVESVADAILRAQAANKKDETPALLAALAPLLDPKRQTDMIAQFAALMKPQGNDTLATILPLLLKLLEKPATDPMLTILLEDRKTMAAQLAELQKSLLVPQKHPLEFLIEHEELGRRLFGRGANSASAEGKTWVDIVEKGIEKIGPALIPLGQGVGAMLMRGNGPHPAQPPRVVNVQPAQSSSVATQPPQAVVEPNPTTPPAAQEQPQDMNLLALQKYQNVIQQSFPFLIDHYKDDEKDGYDFRDWFIKPQRFGNQVWYSLRSEIGVDGIMSLVNTLPSEVQAQLAPSDRFKQFMGEFFTEPGKEPEGYFDDEDDDPADEFEVKS